nr:MAG TPA: hypothetical protein [Herelleviridae sp.]
MTTKIRSRLSRCDVCNREVMAFILFRNDKVYWNNRCAEHSKSIKSFDDYPEMPKEELDADLRSLV